MLGTLKRILRDYPNSGLLALGLLLVAIEEGTAKAVFYTHFGIHYRNWPVPPPIARFVDVWREAHHTILYQTLAISVCVTGATLIAVAYVRWVRAAVYRRRRRPADSPDAPPPGSAGN